MKSKSIRSYLLAGLVVWLPILVTFVILRFIVDLLDQTMALLPKAYQPEQLFGFHLPGLGVLLSLILLMVTGIVATNFLGQRLVWWSESVLERIPLVRSIYNAAKQVIHAIFGANGQSFRKVLLVEYPRKGMWSLAFQTGVSNFEVHTGAEMVSIFIPTTPNPTSGFLMMVPKTEVIELTMSIDEALKFIISLGVMQPVAMGAFAVKEQLSQ
ncbi:MULTISPECIES: DUF502 domain-containing protein [Legionella]|uniref:DUF502 domain-containing protein n=1 Tax=Legionella septentrionalis TaxID=2498109 RepID=A0A3S0XH60_9GAMM|nr:MULTISPECIES: DUF502 domain-containing protein [Legionella]MCP0914440.1 DUF502 domain-containing protein [Legionella sp. 27cVA30]RUQ89494.1 DUF502 domain-containing protein [Legionella septentrionalis]RUQ97334.1 DUF502 domain-containing protein [Legionella septentrionalis]RUR10506.1 DUF502 domain-containing protein [Legionella septentrionalis]RUR16126.1 DUF502 domain-containing protein [Legionella septentrionalis]